MTRNTPTLLFPAFLGSLIFLGTESTPTASAEPNTTRVAPTERPVFARRPVDVPLSAADKGLRDAMQLDPTFTTRSSEGLRQTRAIKAWQELLKRKDLTREQEVFAWWRIGSLAAYNFDPSRGEIADMALAETAFLKVHQIAKDLISIETLNTATVYGGLPGKPTDRAARLAKAYRWLFTRTDDMATDSARNVNHNGHVVDGRLMRGGMRLDTVSKKRNFLRSSLAEYQGIISKRITEEIQYTDDPEAIDGLLKTIGDVADSAVVKKWNAILADVRTRAKQTQPIRTSL